MRARRGIRRGARARASALDHRGSARATPRGAAGFGGDVFTRPDSRDAPHLFGLGIQEILGDEMTAELRSMLEYARDRAQRSGRSERVALRSKGVRRLKMPRVASNRVYARSRYASAGAQKQIAAQKFLESLVLFPPDDTASHLNPGDRHAPDFPQNGHGSIRLPALFLDPTELE